MTHHRRAIASLHRLIDVVEAVDLDNPPTGREAARSHDRLEIAWADAANDLAFLADWLTIHANIQKENR